VYLFLSALVEKEGEEVSSASETFHCMICPLRSITGDKRRLAFHLPLSSCYSSFFNLIFLFLGKGK